MLRDNQFCHFVVMIIVVLCLVVRTKRVWRVIRWGWWRHSWYGRKDAYSSWRGGNLSPPFHFAPCCRRCLITTSRLIEFLSPSFLRLIVQVQATWNVPRKRLKQIRKRRTSLVTQWVSIVIKAIKEQTRKRKLCLWRGEKKRWKFYGSQLSS